MNQWPVYLCEHCGARILIVRAGTFGREAYMVEAEPHEAGYVHLTVDSFGALDEPVGAFCSDAEILRLLREDEDARFHRLHLFCESVREVAA